MSTATMDRPPAPVLDAPVPATASKGVARTRLSDAIREGAKHHPQGQGALYNPQTQTTCALGAAMVGLLGLDWIPGDHWAMDSPVQTIFEHTGVDLLGLSVRPPDDPRCPTDMALGSLIVRLNNCAGWSRERIADYLASIGL